MDGVARMHIAWVHQHHGAGADFEGARAIVVIAAAGGDRTDGIFSFLLSSLVLK
jgi:hypothetical protein